jgi:uncharacterized membrane protein
MFFIAVGILAWIAALGVLWIFAESGGALTVIAAGVFAVVAMVALGCERIISVLEDIRDRRIREVITDQPATARVGELNRRTAGAAPL